MVGLWAVPVRFVCWTGESDCVIVATAHRGIALCGIAGQVFHVPHCHVATVVLSVLARSAEDGEDVRVLAAVTPLWPSTASCRSKLPGYGER